jgi:hypothetical protein
MAAAVAARPVPDPKRWWALALLCSAFFMVILDVSIVNVALPSIQKDLHFAEGDLQWVLSAYALTFGGFLLLGGRTAACSCPASHCSRPPRSSAASRHPRGC